MTGRRQEPVPPVGDGTRSVPPLGDGTRFAPPVGEGSRSVPSLLAELDELTARWRLGAAAALDPAGLTAEQALRVAMRLSVRLGIDVRVPDVLGSGSLPRLIERRRVSGGGAGEPVPAGGAKKALPGGRAGEAVPLSHAQQRFLLDEGIAPAQDDNHVVLAYLLSGPLDPGALAAAYDDVVERHPILRTVHCWDDELGPVQRVLPADPGRSPLDGPVPAPAGRQAGEAAAELCAGWWEQPFDLERQPPLRARLAELGPDAWLLCLSLHHIVFDGQSEPILLRELGAAHAARAKGRPPRWPAIPGYHHYAQWEHDMVDTWAARDLPFWRDLLGSPPPALLPASDLTEQAPRQEHEIALDPAATHDLLAAVRTWGGFPLAAVLHGTARALGRVFDAGRLNLATVSSGRYEGVFDPVVGCFVNPIVFPFAPARDGCPGEGVQETARMALRGLRHARTPYDRVVRALRPGTARRPLYEVMVGLQAPRQAGPFGGTEITVEPVRVRAPRTTAPLIVEVEPQPDGGWTLSARWRTDVVDAPAGRAVVSELADLLTGLRAR
ncbi:condensation domain-containing protein [Nonomuraea sp. B12E4]|uniref:condensation domain-containing protein n=1 Tax=Nonomuraea sp. B12E4 TaxID=3153564 RepID=UPI00325E8E03